MDKRIGAQLYTVRDLCKTKEDFENTMKRLAEIGFKTVQLSGVPADVCGDPIYTRSVFEHYGLECVATHKPYQEFVDDIEAIVDYHKKLNCKVAGIGSAPLDLRKDLPTLKETIKKCNEFHKRLTAEGIQFGWHNHAFEFAKVDENNTVMDVCLAEGEFSFILDTYWLAFVGVNPAKFIKNNGERISVLHYKDIRALDTNAVEYAEVGQGNIDWDEVVATSVTPGCAVIEQDICHGDPVESLKSSYNFLTGKYDFI